MLWPFCPLDGMLEGMEFATDVIPMFDGEQRIRLKDVPWRTFNHSYALNQRQYERARAMMRGVHPAAFELPDWAQAHRVTASAGASSLSFVNAYPFIDVGDSVAIIQNCEQYQELTVSAADANGITLSFPLADDYDDARLCLLLEANAPQGLQGARNVSQIVPSQIEWRSYAGTDIADDGNPPTHRTYPVLTQPACIGSGSMPESILKPFDTVDNALARPFFDTVRQNPIQTLGAAWQPRSKADRYALRQWFYYLRGRQKAFWLPGWNRGIQLTAPINAGGSTIQIRNIGFTDGYGTGDLFIKTTGGSIYTFQVTGSADDSDGTDETLTISGTSPVTISPANVAYASIMFLVRLASDRIEFEHRSIVGPRVVVSCEEVKP